MLIVGLGNPGKKYEGTYHNIGFYVVEALAKKLGVDFKQKGNQAIYAESYYNGEKLIIAKPQTYMNLSGECVKMLANSFHFTQEEILVIYDDIELPLGAVRIRRNGSGGSHNGMKNIVQEMETTSIARVRMGLGDDRGHRDLADYVLSKIPFEKLDILDKIIDKLTDSMIEYIKDKNIDRFMQKCNGLNV